MTETTAHRRRECSMALRGNAPQDIAAIKGTLTSRA
jgi:hypothetical protein